MKIIGMLFILLACSSCVIQKEVNLIVDQGSTADVDVYITGSEVRDNKADGTVDLAPL
jgi:hypothetical protein